MPFKINWKHLQIYKIVWRIKVTDEFQKLLLNLFYFLLIITNNFIKF